MMDIFTLISFMTQAHKVVMYRFLVECVIKMFREPVTDGFSISYCVVKWSIFCVNRKFWNSSLADGKFVAFFLLKIRLQISDIASAV